jgi:DNA mismatch endonuclease (patch repair protein)
MTADTLVSLGKSQGSPVAPADARTSVQMRRMPRSNTKGELLLRRTLHAHGKRFRVQYPVPQMRRRTIDVAFPGRRVAVFFDGCFWHGCLEHRPTPQSNGPWWASKLGANRARDLDTTQHLLSLGWQVVRIWEHEELTTGVDRVLAALDRSSRPPLPPGS